MSKAVTRARRFCPRCGDPEPDRTVGERSLCLSCFLEEHELVDLPEGIELERCQGCGSVRVDDEWRDVEVPTAEVAVSALEERVGVHRLVDGLEWEVTPVPVDDASIRLECAFDLDVGGDRIERRVDVPATVTPTTCRRCSRIAGDDYGSTVQLRGRERRPAEEEVDRARGVVADVLTERVETGDRGAYLTDVIERPEGVDFRLSTPRLGRRVATAVREEVGGTMESSRTLVTTDGDGREVYRVTYALRLPPYRPGDVLEVDGGAALVEAVGEGVRLLDLTTGERRTVPVDEVEGRTAARRSESTPATVVAPLDDHAVQVLHPETSEAVTVARYEGVDLDGDTVETVAVDGRLYLLPTDG